MKIPFCRPYVNEKEAAAAYNAIISGWITTGSITEKLEEKIAKYLGAKHVVLLTSCTAALHLSLEYLKKINKWKEFTAYVPSLTFAATATEVINSGGKVIFGDVEEETMCLNPNTNEKFDVAIPVNLYGVLAKTNYKCPVIVDSAHLIYKDQMKDNPNLTCFSFYATKNITMGEGGAIATNDSNAALWFKQARHHGISKDGWKRYSEKNKWEYNIEFIGWKYNPSDILSSVLNVNFDKIEEINKERQRCVNLYNKLLGYKNKGLHLYEICVSDRNKFMEMMEDNEVSCSVHFLPLDRMTAFKDFKKDNLVNTDYFSDKLVSLPLFPSLKDEEIKYICDIINNTGFLIK